MQCSAAPGSIVIVAVIAVVIVFVVVVVIVLVEGSLEVKLPTIWTDEKHSQEETRTWRKSEGRRSDREKMQVREKVGKSRNTVFFQCFVAPEGRKVGSLKRRVRR